MLFRVGIVLIFFIVSETGCSQKFQKPIERAFVRWIGAAYDGDIDAQGSLSYMFTTKQQFDSINNLLWEMNDESKVTMSLIDIERITEPKSNDEIYYSFIKYKSSLSSPEKLPKGVNGHVSTYALAISSDRKRTWKFIRVSDVVRKIPELEGIDLGWIRKEVFESYFNLKVDWIEFEWKDRDGKNLSGRKVYFEDGSYISDNYYSKYVLEFLNDNIKTGVVFNKHHDRVGRYGFDASNGKYAYRFEYLNKYGVPDSIRTFSSPYMADFTIRTDIKYNDFGLPKLVIDDRGDEVTLEYKKNQSGDIVEIKITKSDKVEYRFFEGENVVSKLTVMENGFTSRIDYTLNDEHLITELREYVYAKSRDKWYQKRREVYEYGQSGNLATKKSFNKDGALIRQYFYSHLSID